LWVVQSSDGRAGRACGEGANYRVLVVVTAPVWLDTRLHSPSRHNGMLLTRPAEHHERVLSWDLLASRVLLHHVLENRQLDGGAAFRECNAVYGQQANSLVYCKALFLACLGHLCLSVILRTHLPLHKETSFRASNAVASSTGSRSLPLLIEVLCTERMYHIALKAVPHDGHSTRPISTAGALSCLACRPAACRLPLAPAALSSCSTPTVPLAMSFESFWERPRRHCACMTRGGVTRSPSRLCRAHQITHQVRSDGTRERSLSTSFYAKYKTQVVTGPHGMTCTRSRPPV
jgi:hypothetical protein